LESREIRGTCGEGIALTDAHWAVIIVLRMYYLEHGLSINARTTAMMLNHNSPAGLAINTCAGLLEEGR